MNQIIVTDLFLTGFWKSFVY